MSDFDTHLCLVSDQPLPNLIPILFEPTRPQRVVLLTSRDMTEPAYRLTTLLRGLRLQVREEPIDPFDQRAAAETVAAVLASEPSPNIALNATGGSRNAALAAYQLFHQQQRPILTVDPGLDRIRFLTDEADMAVPNLVEPPLYLETYGFRIVNQEGRCPRTYETAARTLASQTVRLGGAMDRLAHLAAGAEAGRGGLVVQEPTPSDHNLQELADLLMRQGILDTVRRGGTDYISFPSEADQRFAMGGWLKAHVCAIIRTLPEIGGLRLGLKIEGPHGEKDELDVAFTHQNRLHVIQCQTGVAESQAAPQPGGRWPWAHKAQKVADPFKHDCLLDLVGHLGGRVMLVSAGALPEQDRIQAQELRVPTVVGSHLSTLSQTIRRWLQE